MYIITPPPPPLAISTPAGGDRHFTVLRGNIDCGGLCSPSVAHTFLHCFPISSNFKSVTCAYSVIFSLQRRCAGCCVPFSDPRCFLPVTVYGTTHAHLLRMSWPLLWGLHQMGCSFATCGTYALVGHESAQLSRLEAVVVASPKSLHLCSVSLHQWRVPQFALKYPCNPPPPPVVRKGGRLQGGGAMRIYIDVHVHGHRLSGAQNDFGYGPHYHDAFWPAECR